MASLVITIISLAIFAIVAAMGIYYGGQAFQNGQINATASTIISEAQQILTAERMWSTLNNQTDISGMGTAGASGTGMSALVNSKSLSTWPSFGGTLAMSSSMTNPGPQPWIAVGNTSGTINTGSYDNGCYNVGGYSGKFYRSIFSYKNGNYVFYQFLVSMPNNTCAYNGSQNWINSTNDMSNANHPIVLIAKAINAGLNQIPANADKSAMPYIGLPQPPAGATIGSASTLIYDSSQTSGAGNPRLQIDSNGTLQSNYCYISQFQWLTCVFGPS